MGIFKDRILLVFITLAVLTGGMLIVNNLSLLSYRPNSKPEAPVVDKAIADMADQIEKNTNLQTYTPATIPAVQTTTTDDAALAAAEEAKNKQIENDLKIDSPPAPATAPSPPTGAMQAAGKMAKAAPAYNGTANVYGNQIPIKRSRPKLGANEWLVGPGAGADSTELTNILKNVVDGDIVTVSPGVYEFDQAEIPASKFEIHGSDGTILVFKKNYRKISSPKLLIKNVKLDFPAGETHVSINSNVSDMIFENVTINKPGFRLGFYDNTKVTFKNSSFFGTGLAFGNFTVGTFEKCFFEKSDSFITLYDHSKVFLNDTKMMTFTSSAIYTGSAFVEIKANNLRISNGFSAFSGKGQESNISIRDSEFKNLDYFTNQDMKVSCAACQKTNIKH